MKHVTTVETAFKIIVICWNGMFELMTDSMHEHTHLPQYIKETDKEMVGILMPSLFNQFSSSV